MAIMQSHKCKAVTSLVLATGYACAFLSIPLPAPHKLGARSTKLCILQMRKQINWSAGHQSLDYFFQAPSSFADLKNSRKTRHQAIAQIFGEDDEGDDDMDETITATTETLDDLDEVLDVDELDINDPIDPRSRVPKDLRSSKLSEDDEEEEISGAAAEILERFPDAPRVKVDDMGNVIEGGEDPYDDPENNIYRGKPNKMGEDDYWPEVAGEIGGMDDPPDAPWRRKAEDIIRREILASSLNCYDIMWSYHKLEITVTRGDVPEDSDDAGYVDSDALMKAIRAVNSSLEEVEDELQVLSRHELIIATPGADDILTTDREFKAFKGFDVIVVTGSTFNIYKEVTGKLHERTFDEIIIIQNGRKVRIPVSLVDEVRLPKAKMEPGEQWVS